MKVHAIAFHAACAAALLLLGTSVASATIQVQLSDNRGAPKVYTMDEVNAISGELSMRIQGVRHDYMEDLGISVRESEQRMKEDLGISVRESEQRMKDEVKASIDNLPQRLLTEEAKKALKDAVETELNEENAQLRQDIQTLQGQYSTLQGQYSALQQDVETLKKAIKPR